MGLKFDQQKTKHNLIHISINLGVVLLCMSYLQNGKRLLKLGKLWESLLIPIILAGEICKLCLARYFISKDKIIVTNKQKKKGFMSFGDAMRAFILQATCVLFYGLICVILGAPVLHSYEETFVLALILTLMTVSPAVFLVGASGTLQAAFCEVSEYLTKSEETALELVKLNAAGTIFGAWAGSIVAPLDWDREWQAYPIPNIIGALLGSGLVNIFTCSRVLIATGKMYLNKKKF